MAWREILFGSKPVSAPATTQRPTKNKIVYNIRRFRMALEQCEKGPARLAELQRNLDYWLAIEAAEEGLN